MATNVHFPEVTGVSQPNSSPPLRGGRHCRVLAANTRMGTLSKDWTMNDRFHMDEFIIHPAFAVRNRASFTRASCVENDRCITSGALLQPNTPLGSCEYARCRRYSDHAEIEKRQRGVAMGVTLADAILHQ